MVWDKQKICTNKNLQTWEAGSGVWWGLHRKREEAPDLSRLLKTNSHWLGQGQNFSPHLDIQMLDSMYPVCRTLSHMLLWSSLCTMNLLRVDSASFSRSLIKILEYLSEPLGTPLVTCLQLNFLPLITTLWVQSFISIHLTAHLSNPS